MAELKTFLVVNPQSANGRTGSRFPEISAAVKSGLGDFDHAFTTRQGHATDLARDALKRGFQRVVAVGGDGTVNEVVNGFFEGEMVIDPEAVFAVIPRGTGGDFRKTFGWSNELPDAIQRLKNPQLGRIDVGRMKLTDPRGITQTRYFINVASCGVSGVVDDEVNHTSKALGGPLSFKWASLKALLKYTDQRVKVTFDDGQPEEMAITCLSVGNGQYFGGGMWVCPKAQPDDGIFDVTIWSGFKLSDFVLKQGRIYDGSHLDMPGVRSLRAKRIKVEGPPVLLDVDGEQPGTVPALFEMVPSAIRINR